MVFIAMNFVLASEAMAGECSLDKKYAVETWHLLSPSCEGGITVGEALGKVPGDYPADKVIYKFDQQTGEYRLYQESDILPDAFWLYVSFPIEKTVEVSFRGQEFDGNISITAGESPWFMSGNAHGNTTSASDAYVAGSQYRSLSKAREDDVISAMYTWNGIKFVKVVDKASLASDQGFFVKAGTSIARGLQATERLRLEPEELREVLGSDDIAEILATFNPYDYIKGDPNAGIYGILPDPSGNGWIIAIAPGRPAQNNANGAVIARLHGDGTTDVLGILDEQGTLDMTRIGDAIHIAGVDACCRPGTEGDHTNGNHYILVDDELTKIRNLADALHVWSLHYNEGTLYAAVSLDYRTGNGGSQIRTSTNLGQTWEVLVTGNEVLVTGNEVLVTGNEVVSFSYRMYDFMTFPDNPGTMVAVGNAIDNYDTCRVGISYDGGTTWVENVVEVACATRLTQYKNRIVTTDTAGEMLVSIGADGSVNTYDFDGFNAVGTHVISATAKMFSSGQGVVGYWSMLTTVTGLQSQNWEKWKLSMLSTQAQMVLS